ncbi:hypothetical protein Nepgr_015154 [Nepenthes gracilis]|uniref:Ribosomal protein S9 n=1 Tax=Nepenthes gracilis TaxID=150966 RepID=A0AAD3SLA5_NEPGR|nr:hypothetical protein Nepgr_015154 [Nepenthes gracilis]
MLLRFITKPTRHLCSLSVTLSAHFQTQAQSSVLLPSRLISSSVASPLSTRNLNFAFASLNIRLLSTNQNNNNNNNNEDRQATSDIWRFSTENDNTDNSIFGTDDDSAGISEGNTERELKGQDSVWSVESGPTGEGDIFERVDKEFSESGDAGDAIANDDGWATAPGYKPWSLGEEEKLEDVFDIGDVGGMREIGSIGEVKDGEKQNSEEDKQLEKEEQMLNAVLKGPNRAFGDLVAASGISDTMLDSLMALKNFQNIEGLPPLTEIEDARYDKSTRKSTRNEVERQKQEEVAKARVRQVDEKGRAYGTGRRKCSIARVWIQPGDGKFFVNEKEFDVYFPMLDHRAALLRPFSETNTLGLWDVKCTVKGGGVSGQVGAIRLGISRALQCWEPGLRPPLREAGFLMRDPRVVERKKPGKAKARKSFQWVKR